uniref:non-specific serine/threonine protein kinase n=1 Tax=Poecilia latipinna TaxID=48699 RepID=A0A3B3VT43_9TELE
MTSRRPMTRSFSGNGRTSSFSEEEGSSSNGRSESRNTYLSNVRPENRSTLCSVMAQLTEDIQPSFETTLKSKAVSENCSVKFTCVVSGYPAPELKWYKDDMEMDRYCGLPKYEIHRNGKTHTLHIYNCTLDDAAIYQVSASNSKGIVSCSGVLEVGTMNEYKIHQRFFAKLKQKAEKKKRDFEEKGKKDNKENIKKEEQRSSPEHPSRKRSVPLLEEKPVVNNSATAEQPGDVAQSKALIAEGKDAGDIASVMKSERSQLESIKDTRLDDEEMSEPKTLGVTEDNANNTYALEEHSKTSYGKSNDLIWSAEHDCSTVNIPSIQISTTEDIPDIKLPVPETNMSEEFIIPAINTMEPDLKECTLPLSILAQNKPGLNDLQKHDATHESKTGIQEERVTDFPGTAPTQRGMQRTDDLSPTEKLKEVAQEMHKHQSSPQLPLMEYASIPVINVSCSDDLESNALGISSVCGTEKAFETQTETLFVVPPISVSCHESEAELKPPAPTKTTETETSASTPKGTKQGVAENLSERPEIPKRKKDLKEISDKSLKENTPSMVGETPMSKVGGSMPTFSKPTDDNIVPESLKQKSPKDTKRESSVEDFLKNRPSVERLSSKPPTYPSLSPSSLRKFMSKAAPDLDNETTANVPAISVEDRQSDKADEDFSGGSTPTSSLSCESSPRLKRRDSLTLIRSATPEELASGARRKIFIPKREEELEGAVFSVLEGKKESPYMSPSQARRAALLQASTGQKTPPMERRSPLMSRRKATLEVPKVVEETPTLELTSNKVEDKPAGKKTDPLKGKQSIIIHYLVLEKAPQVIRKIRGEPFPDASGHLKLWCQFFNVLSDSTIKWFKDEEEILEMKRSGGDESQVALAIVHASSQDCGVYGCTISNEYGTDTTDFLLSEEILSEFLLKEDLEVGEEIEMTPLVYTKGLADSGTWGEKYFGRIFTETVHIGEGCTHKASRVKVIYGLDPIFESGTTCIIKIRNPIAYGTKQESTLAERNLDIAKQECKVQDMIREYCKIFAAEARVNENFGFSLEVIPRYLIHRPANSVPYATVETDLTGDFGKYCTIDLKGKLFSQNISELDQKCCTFQHWIHQWTHGNLLVTQLEGKYQGLTECGSPEVFDQFVMHHQCNYYCGLLGLRALKTDLQQPAKIKGSRSPLLNRKLGSNSPQLQKKGQSPQLSRKSNVSPKIARKAQETDNSNSDEKQKPTESLS